jgi:hypothetical protein
MPGVGGFVKQKEIELFEKSYGQVEALYEEIGKLSKKSPNDALNKFKLKLINGLLSEANLLLKGDYRPLEGFRLFSEDDIPTNSDVTMVLAQYLNCLEKMRVDNICQDDLGSWVWIVDGCKSEIHTAEPKKLRVK